MNRTKRLGKTTTAQYSSFKEVAKAFNCEPFTKMTKNKKKLKMQQNTFLGTCRVCGASLKYIQDTNILVCANPDCEGVVKKGKDGTEVHYPIKNILSEKGMDIALTLFS